MTPDKSPQTIKTTFNLIAEKYDFINNIMSFGTQNYIKHQCIKNLGIRPHDRIIYLCCGTGDLTEIILKIEPKAQITGIDFSENMLNIAKKKNITRKIQYFEGDITNLPYEDNSFDFATISFGLRNIANPEKAIEEIYRILKPKGTFMHLDFGEKNFVSKFFDIIAPNLAGVFTDNKSAYNYLIESKKIFPSPDDLIKDFSKKGFVLKKREDYIFHVISSQIMTKN